MGSSLTILVATSFSRALLTVSKVSVSMYKGD